MPSTHIKVNTHPLNQYIERLKSGKTLLPDSPDNVLEVVGILDSYGVVLDAYYRNLIYVAQEQFLVLFPFFKYFNGQVSPQKLLQHWGHDRINYEYAEYCMRTMLWHGGGGLDQYLDSPEFKSNAQKAIAARLKGNWLIQGLNRLFPEFLLEQVRLSAYTSALGQFWQVMSPIFLTMARRYEQGKITTIPEVVDYIKAGLVEAAAQPISYSVNLNGQDYPIIPASAGLTFLADTAVPYVEAVFFRGTPFPGTVSYNAQANQIDQDQARFEYGALFADPVPIGGAGIPPTLLMQDMRHYLPEYLMEFYRQSLRGEDDLRVKICQTFQKSMFCVTNAAIVGLLPHPIDTEDPDQQAANQAYLESWMDRLQTSRIEVVQV